MYVRHELYAACAPQYAATKQLQEKQIETKRGKEEEEKVAIYNIQMLPARRKEKYSAAIIYYCNDHSKISQRNFLNLSLTAVQNFMVILYYTISESKRHQL